SKPIFTDGLYRLQQNQDHHEGDPEPEDCEQWRQASACSLDQDSFIEAFWTQVSQPKTPVKPIATSRADKFAAFPHVPHHTPPGWEAESRLAGLPELRQNVNDQLKIPSAAARTARCGCGV